MNDIKDSLLRASSAAIDAWEGGCDLTTATFKQASERGYTAEQARKLVHFVNTQAHMRLHHKNAGAPVNRVEFDVADPNEVLARMGMPAGALPGAPKLASDRDSVSAAYDYYGPAPGVVEKVAAYEPPPMTASEVEVLRSTTPDNSLRNPVLRERAVNHLKQASAIARNKAYDAVAVYDRRIDDLCDDVRRGRISGSKLASHMVGLYPDVAADVCLEVFRRLPGEYAPGPDTRPCGPVVEAHQTHSKMAAAVEAHRDVNATYSVYTDLVRKVSPYG